MTPNHPYFNKMVTKMFNTLGNQIIKSKLSKDIEYNFSVRVRKGSYDEPYKWVIEVTSFPEIPPFLYSRKKGEIESVPKEYFEEMFLGLLKQIGFSTEGTGGSVKVRIN